MAAALVVRVGTDFCCFRHQEIQLPGGEFIELLEFQFAAQKVIQVKN